MTTCLPRVAAHLIQIESRQPLSYTLTADICTIGRSPLCQVLIPQAIVSRLHARIERNGSQYYLADVGSANGTFVNGRPIHQPHLLVDGDLIGLGSATPMLRFEA